MPCDVTLSLDILMSKTYVGHEKCQNTRYDTFFKDKFQCARLAEP